MRYKAIKIILASVSEPSLISSSKFLFLIVFIFFSCRERVTPPDVPRYISPIMLAVEDASCTDAYLRIKTTKAFESGVIQLRREGSTRIEISNISSQLDTLVIDEGLLPKRDYRYTAYRVDGGVLVDSSAELRITTMDTTSHEFRWEIDTLGDGASSVLYDVAIINDTLAYAVGEIYKRDSLGNWDPNAYNLVKWNGNTWQLMRIQFYTFCGQTSTGSYPAKSIFAFSPTDVWIGMYGSQVVRWNGQTQTAPMCTPVSINKLWGENPVSVWAVGVNGGIAHYNGTSWRRIESGTTLDIQDIWGERNPQTGEMEILTIASNLFQNQGAKLLSIQGNIVTQMPDSGLTWGVNALWFSQSKKYYVVGPGIHQKRSLYDPVWSVYPPGQVTSYFSSGVCGTNVNDVFVVGAFREAVHFNGVTWKRYNELMPGTPGVFAEVAVKSDLIVIVGFVSQYALAIIGRR